MRERDSVRILVLGDERVGKSSLISTFVSQCFPDKVPAVLTPVQIPASESPDLMATVIVDTAGDAPLEHLVARIKEADAMVLVYDVARRETYDRLSSHWLPLIERTLQLQPTTTQQQPQQQQSSSVAGGGGGGKGAAGGGGEINKAWGPGGYPKPVVLAANKCDLLPSPTSSLLLASSSSSSLALAAASAAASTSLPLSSYAATEHGMSGGGGSGAASDSVRRAQAVMERFRFALQSFDVSAKRQEQVADVFLMASRLVLYPFWPLFDMGSADLTPKLKRVLTRIFRIFDADADGLLKDTELNCLQKKCFGSELQEEDIKGVKKMITKGCEHGVARARRRDGREEEGVTLDGFVEIIRLFLFNMQVDMPWAMLRALHYDDDLEWEDPDYWSTLQGSGALSSDPEDSWELSCEALSFLAHAFDLHAEAEEVDGAKAGQSGRVLTAGKMHEVFSVLPDAALPPWATLASPSPSSSSFEDATRRWHVSPRWPQAASAGGGGVDAPTWLALWELTASLSPVTAARTLMYLGMAVAPEAIVHNHGRWGSGSGGKRAHKPKGRHGGSGGGGGCQGRGSFHALFFMPPASAAAATAAAQGLFDALMLLAPAGEEEDEAAAAQASARVVTAAAPSTTASSSNTSTANANESAAATQSPPPPSSMATTLEALARDGGAGAVAALLMDGGAAVLTATRVSPRGTEKGLEEGSAADLALLPYLPNDAASIERALDLARRLPDALPRLFVEMPPPTDTAAAGATASASSSSSSSSLNEGGRQQQQQQPSAEAIRAACAGPKHSFFVLSAAPSGHDALLREAAHLAGAFGRGGSGSGAGGGKRRGYRQGRGGAGSRGGGREDWVTDLASRLVAGDPPVVLGAGLALAGVVGFVMVFASGRQRHKG